MNIKDRLQQLESKRQLTPLCIIYRDSDSLSDEQQARIDAAEAEGRPVKLIRTTRAEANFIQDPVTLRWAIGESKHKT